MDLKGLKELSELLKACSVDVSSGVKMQKEEGAPHIVVFQRGFVAVGRLFLDGEDGRLENAAIVRIWGTTKGLGQIAQDGPTRETVLDPCPPIKFNALTTVFNMECNESKWKTVLK